MPPYGSIISTSQIGERQIRSAALKACCLLLCAILVCGIAGTVRAAQALAAEPEIETDINKLNGANWMSGISGDRYLHEITMPGTHDSSMCNVGMNSSLTGLAAKAFTEAAHTQDRYLDQQLTDGIRIFDLRLTDETPYGMAQDGKSVWLCHGPSPAGKLASFTFYAQDHKDNHLTFDDAMKYYSDFLKAHPTETLVVSVTNESGTGNKGEIFRRAAATIKKWEKQINPSTGKSYVYKTSRGSIIEDMPQLKDTRGQIVFVSDNEGYLTYGMHFMTSNDWGFTKLGGVDFAFENHFDTDNETKLKYVEALYKGGTLNGKTFAAQKASVTTSIGAKLNHGVWVGTTSNKFGKGGWWPRSISKFVNPRVFTNSDALMNTRGVFYGWVSVDFATPEIARAIWLNNYPTNGLDYVTVSFDANGATGTMSSVRVQKGSTFTLPESKFTGPNGKSLSEWKVGSEMKRAGEAITVNADTTVQAQWGMTWKDLQAEMRKAKIGEPFTITVASDITAITYDSRLIIPEGKDITIDLNGHTINRNAKAPDTQGRDFFYVAGKLTLKNGTVKGGISSHGGGIYVSGTGDLTLDDVTVTGNAATLKGGGVYVASYGDKVGKISIKGATSISGNTLYKKDDSASNLWLSKDAVVEAGDGFNPPQPISIDTEVKPTTAASVYFTSRLANADYKNKFTSERGYSIVLGEGDHAFLQSLKKVTFVEGSLNANRVVSVPAGSRVEVPASPAREGYVFAGWYKEGASEAYDFATPVTENITLRAKWTPVKTVTFNSEGGTSVQAQNVESGGVATRPADPVKDGYDFKYWAQSKAIVTDGSFDYKLVQYDFATPVTNNLELKAVWQKHDSGGSGATPAGTVHTVTFDNGSGQTTQSVADGAHATQPATDPAKEGFLFAGWYEEGKYELAPSAAENFMNDPDLNRYYWVVARDAKYYVRYLFNFASQPIIEDTTLYARWIPSGTYSVTFNANGGENAPGAQSGIAYGSNVSEPSAAPTREHYCFTGWYTDEACAQLYDFTMPVVKSIDLYAGWQPEEYIVSFATGTDVELDDQIVAYGGKVAKPEADPVLAGHAFKGWYEGEATAPYDFENSSITDDLVLVALWEENADANLKVTFDALGGNPVPPVQSVAYGAAATEPAANPAREGFEFEGWFAQYPGELSQEELNWLKGDLSLSQEYWITDDNHLRYPYDFASESVSGDLTLYARWSPKENTVTFVDDAGEVVMEQIVQSGDMVIEPDGTSSGSHLFAGWFADAEHTTKFDYSTPISKNTTIYGAWPEVLYTVAFDNNGGSAVLPQTQKVVYGGLAAKPDNPVWKGHVFRGWYEDLSGAMTPEELEMIKREYLPDYADEYSDATGDDYVDANEVLKYLDDNVIVEDGKVMLAYHPESDPVVGDLTVKALWTEGEMRTDVVVSEGAPHVEAPNLHEIALRLLTTEELEKGAHVWLDVKVLNEADVPEADRTLLLNHAAKLGATPDMWLDISLYKEVDGAVTQVHETEKPLKLTLAVPEKLRASNGETRTFHLSRAHDSASTTVLEGSTDIVEGYSDRFSTHLLSHSDAAGARAAIWRMSRMGDALPTAIVVGMVLAALGATLFSRAKGRKVTNGNKR